MPFEYPYDDSVALQAKKLGVTDWRPEMDEGKATRPLLDPLDAVVDAFCRRACSVAAPEYT